MIKRPVTRLQAAAKIHMIYHGRLGVRVYDEPLLFGIIATITNLDTTNDTINAALTAQKLRHIRPRPQMQSNGRVHCKRRSMRDDYA